MDEPAEEDRPGDGGADQVPAGRLPVSHRVDALLRGVVPNERWRVESRGTDVTNGRTGAPRHSCGRVRKRSGAAGDYRHGESIGTTWFDSLAHRAESTVPD